MSDEKNGDDKKIGLVPTLLLILLALNIFVFYLNHNQAIYRQMLIGFVRQSHSMTTQNVPTNSTIFLGDSLTMAIPNGIYFTKSVNFGIGYQTTKDLLTSMDVYYWSLKNAKQVIITIGTNDLIQKKEKDYEENLLAIMNKIPANIPIILETIPPNISKNNKTKVEAAKVDNVNAIIRKTCTNDKRCKLFDLNAALTQSGIPNKELFWDDGVHLSGVAYAIWINGLRKIII